MRPRSLRPQSVPMSAWCRYRQLSCFRMPPPRGSIANGGARRAPCKGRAFHRARIFAGQLVRDRLEAPRDRAGFWPIWSLGTPRISRDCVWCRTDITFSTAYCMAMSHVASRLRKQAVFGSALAFVLILKVSIPYLVMVSVYLWLAGQVLGFEDGWRWGLIVAVPLGFLMLKGREFESARRASPFSWHQGHYWVIPLVARVGLRLWSTFRIKSGPDILRELGGEKHPIEKEGEIDADPIRRHRRELGYDDPPPDS